MGAAAAVAMAAAAVCSSASAAWCDRLHVACPVRPSTKRGRVQPGSMQMDAPPSNGGGGRSSPPSSTAMPTGTSDGLMPSAARMSLRMSSLERFGGKPRRGLPTPPVARETWRPVSTFAARNAAMGESGVSASMRARASRYGSGAGGVSG